MLPKNEMELAGTPPVSQVSSAGAATGVAPARKPETPKPAAKILPGMDKLGAGIQEMVQAELRTAGIKPGKAEDAEKGDRLGRWDIVFLVLGAVNLALLVWLIPEDALKDERIKTLKDLLPWIFGSLFVLVTRWYHDGVLKISRKKAFRVADVALFLLLSGVWAPIVPLPAIDPPDAQLSLIDDKEAPRLMKGTHRISLLRKHTYRLEKYDSNEPNQRPFTTTGWELWQEKLSNPHLHWSLLYYVRITAQPGTKVKIVRKDSAFDQDFLENLDKKKLSRISSNQDDAVEFKMPDTLAAATQLPVGHYELKSDSGNCTFDKEKDYATLDYLAFDRRTGTWTLKVDPEITTLFTLVVKGCK